MIPFQYEMYQSLIFTLKGNYEFIRLEPLDDDDKIKKELDRVMEILEFEVAERILLGAQLRKHEVRKK